MTLFQCKDFSCDFCGEPASKLTRVAVAKDYDRLTDGGRPKYACPQCSAAKERQRLGLDKLDRH